MEIELLIDPGSVAGCAAAFIARKHAQRLPRASRVQPRSLVILFAKRRAEAMQLTPAGGDQP
jgi:hypothetical protein